MHYFTNPSRSKNPNNLCSYWYEAVQISKGLHYYCHFDGVLLPSVIDNIPDQLVTTGFNVTFNCNAEGSDNISYRWNRIFSETMVERGFDDSMPGRRVFGESTATLTILNVGVEDEGEYACFVSVSGTRVGTRTASLTTQGEYQCSGMTTSNNTTNSCTAYCS